MSVRREEVETLCDLFATESTNLIQEVSRIAEALDRIDTLDAVISSARITASFAGLTSLIAARQEQIRRS